MRTAGVADGRLHIVQGKSWLVAPAPDQDPQVLKGTLPSELQHFGPIVSSSHYGLVVLASGTLWYLRPYQVSISPEVLAQLDARGKQKLAEAADPGERVRQALERTQELEPGPTFSELIAPWWPLAVAAIPGGGLLVWIWLRGRARRARAAKANAQGVSK